MQVSLVVCCTCRILGGRENYNTKNQRILIGMIAVTVEQQEKGRGNVLEIMPIFFRLMYNNLIRTSIPHVQ